MRTALVAGASGLSGASLLRILLQSTHYKQVIIFVRKTIDLNHPKLEQVVVDFDHLDSLVLKDSVTDAYCTLGTTIADAGSKSAFFKVDHDYVCSFARKAKENGATGLFVVSSMGADPKSLVFYSRIKGKTEEELKKSGFRRLYIFRPSLLLGPRREKRFLERPTAFFMKRLSFVIPLNFKAITAQKVAFRMVEEAVKQKEGIFVLESGSLQ